MTGRPSMVSIFLPCASMASTRAGVDALAVHDHRAGAAGAAVADPLGAGHVEMIAQRVEQRDARLDRQAYGFAVDLEGDRDRAGTGEICAARRGLRLRLSSRPVPSGAATDAHAADKSAAGKPVRLSGLGSFLELTRHLPFAYGLFCGNEAKYIKWRGWGEGIKRSVSHMRGKYKMGSYGFVCAGSFSVQGDRVAENKGFACQGMPICPNQFEFRGPRNSAWKPPHVWRYTTSGG